MLLFLSRKRPIRTLILISSSIFVFLLIFIGMTPLTSPLPSYSGPHQVGIIDLEADCETKTISNAVFKENGRIAFELNTVFMTLFYPTAHPKNPLASTPPAQQHPWVPRPVSLTGVGYARLARVPFLGPLFTWALNFLVGSTRIPGFADAPLVTRQPEILKDGTNVESLSSYSDEDEQTIVIGDDGKKLPVIVFSHGMAGMRTSYSHYLGSLASRGYVVAAIEHRDGSGPGTIVRTSDGDSSTIYHFGLNDLTLDSPMDPEEFKAAQLAFRQAEVAETIRVLRLIDEGHGDSLQSKNPHGEGAYLHTFRNRLDLTNVTMAGHSFGATLAMQTLKDAPSKEMPLNGAIVLDPGKQSGPLNKEISVPILIANSGAWTRSRSDFYGEDHFDVVKGIVGSLTAKDIGAWFMTLLGTAHPSSTDAPIIAPWIMRLATGTTLNGRQALTEYIEASADFLDFLKDGEKRGVLGREATDPNGKSEFEKEKEDDGNWAVHVSPE